MEFDFHGPSSASPADRYSSPSPEDWSQVSSAEDRAPRPGATARRVLVRAGFCNWRQPSGRRAILAHQSKRYRALREKTPADPLPLSEAIKKLKTFGTTKFIQTVEVSTNLGIDPRQSDQ